MDVGQFIIRQEASNYKGSPIIGSAPADPSDKERPARADRWQ